MSRSMYSHKDRDRIRTIGWTKPFFGDTNCPCSISDNQPVVGILNTTSREQRPWKWCSIPPNAQAEVERSQKLARRHSGDLRSAIKVTINHTDPRERGAI